MKKMIYEEHGFVYERSNLINLNMSSIFTNLIKRAAECDSYSSDLLIDIVPIFNALNGGVDDFKNLCISGSNNNTGADKERLFIHILGFRDMGVDHLSFIKSRVGKENYKSLVSIEVEHCDNKFFARLYEIDADEVYKICSGS